METLTNYIGGEQRAPESGAYLDNIDPSTGQVYSRIPRSDERDVEAAVEAARAAQPAWGNAAADERSRVMLRVADLIERDLDDLARAECVDNGKPLKLARAVDIPRAVSNFRFFATAILHTRTDCHDQHPISLNYTLRRPIGVVGCISPWNLPLYLFTWKIAPALATGNAVVAKPSEVTPYTAWKLGELCAEAGMPPGVLNIVHGDGGGAGAAIVEHPAVKAISFTGGTSTGAAIARTAAPVFKKLSLELGGKNPNLVFADADFDAALSTSVRAAFANQGQICLCGSRILVEQSIHDQFVEAFVEKVKTLTVGDPLDEDSRLGAIVSRAHLEKIAAMVDRARDDGGRIRCGGEIVQVASDRCRDGCFYAPTVITGLPSTCEANQEEIFGPVVTIQPFNDETHALELANNVKYGLASMIWTNDLRRAHRVAAAVEAGVVWINCWLVRDLRTPFGGMKASGVGREGGEEALRFFTEPKNICLA